MLTLSPVVMMSSWPSPAASCASLRLKFDCRREQDEPREQEPRLDLGAVLLCLHNSRFVPELQRISCRVGCIWTFNSEVGAPKRGATSANCFWSELLHPPGLLRVDLYPLDDCHACLGVDSPREHRDADEDKEPLSALRTPTRCRSTRGIPALCADPDGQQLRDIVAVDVFRNSHEDPLRLDDAMDIEDTLAENQHVHKAL